jgi:hypothetical protein
VTEVQEPQAIQILDDLLGNVPMAQNPARAQPPAAMPFSAPPSSITQAAPASATTQAVPGTQTPTKTGPVVANIPTVVARGAVVSSGGNSPQALVDVSSEATFEANFAKLIAKDLELAQHDRSMAIALFQTHLDRAEVLDTMALSMPVATVISDNTGATLKSLELAMKAGERVHKAAELLVAAQRNGDAAMLAALKLKQGGKDGDDWGGETPP